MSFCHWDCCVASTLLLTVSFCCRCRFVATVPLMPVPLCCRCHFVASIPLMPVPFCCLCHFVASTFLCPSFVSALFFWSMFLCYFLIMPVFYVACVPLLSVPFCCLCPLVACAFLLPVPFCCQYPSVAGASFDGTRLVPMPFCAVSPARPSCCHNLSVASVFLLPVPFSDYVASDFLLPVPFCYQSTSAACAFLLSVIEGAHGCCTTPFCLGLLFVCFWFMVVGRGGGGGGLPSAIHTGRRAATSEVKPVAGFQVERLHWLFTDGVGTSATVAAKAAPFTSKFISISAATTPLQDVREFFLEALDEPRSLGPAWHALATRYLRAQLGCVHDSAAVERCGLREKIEVYDYVPAALDALYSMAVLLSSAHAAACGTASGFCRNLSLAVEAGVLSLVRPQVLNFSLHFSPQRLPRLYAAGRMLVPDEFGDFLPANSPLYFINSAANGRWTKVAHEIRPWGLGFSGSLVLRRRT